VVETLARLLEMVSKLVCCASKPVLAIHSDLNIFLLLHFTGV